MRGSLDQGQAPALDVRLPLSMMALRCGGCTPLKDSGQKRGSNKNTGRWFWDGGLRFAVNEVVHDDCIQRCIACGKNRLPNVIERGRPIHRR